MTLLCRLRNVRPEMDLSSFPNKTHMIVIESSSGIHRFKQDDFNGTVPFYDGVIHFLNHLNLTHQTGKVLSAFYSQKLCNV